MRILFASHGIDNMFFTRRSATICRNAVAHSLRFSYRARGFKRNTVRAIEDRVSIVIPLVIVLLPA